MTVLLSVWGVLTGALIILLIYRGTLNMHEDDQLFLNDSESQLQAEQTELMHRMDRITPMVRLLGAASALLVLVIAGMWIWQGVMQNTL
jgi:hypothetical protein